MPSSEQYSPYGGFRGDLEDDVIQGCWEWLSGKPDLMELLGHIPGIAPYTPLLYANELDVIIEGLETNAVVVKHLGGVKQGGIGGAAYSQNTVEFPHIVLEFWCDSLRQEDGQVIEENETIRRMYHIYKKFDRYMNRIAALGAYGMIEWWGDVRTVGCRRMGEFTCHPVPDGDGLQLGEVLYRVELA